MCPADVHVVIYVSFRQTLLHLSWCMPIVLPARISHECGLYLLAAVKFVYAFFPKEQYSREYTGHEGFCLNYTTAVTELSLMLSFMPHASTGQGVHKVLEQNPAAQRKLETLYRLCMKDLLSTERIYQLISKRPALAEQFYADFRKIALGHAPSFDELRAPDFLLHT